MRAPRIPVAFPGVIRSAEHQARCTVEATEVMKPGHPPELLHFRIHNRSLSAALPNGIYLVEANGETIRVRRDGDYWIAA